MEGQEKTVRGIKTFLKTLVTVVLFIIYMFPFYMIVLNAFKHKRDIIKMPLSWKPSAARCGRWAALAVLWPLPC